MIVKMQKITLVVSEREREAALDKLRKLGVLHIQGIKEQPSGEDFQVLETEKDNIEKALQIAGEDQTVSENMMSNAGEGADQVQQILSLAGQLDRLNRELEELNEKNRWFEKWGNISRASLQTLKEAGVFVRFYTAGKNELKNLPPDKIIHVVKTVQNSVYFALISDSPDDRLDFKEMPIPGIEVAGLNERIRELKAEIENTRNELKGFSGIKQNLVAYQVELDKRLEFQKIEHSMGAEKNIAYLQGFCPNDYVSQLKYMANREGWGYLIEEPGDADEVPTLIRIPQWLRIIDPVFKFMGTVPGYREFDISFWFLLFFSIFFALLIGDAGYGLIFLLINFIFSRKFPQTPKDNTILFYVLSGTTIFWGTISGTWFGYEGIARLPLLSSLVIERVDSFIDANQYFMMYLSFIIGIIHLTIARITSAIKVINSLKALAEIGWIAILWALFFIAGNLVLGNAVPDFTLGIFILGFVLVLFFSDPQKNILKGALLTLSNLPLNIISSFSDVVSYIRLFAVGLATVIVASSFNDMAMDIGFDSVTTGLMAAFILFVGHSLNIMLGLMAVVVHGIRLNMLEFSGHLNMQWSGKPYQPFKE